MALPFLSTYRLQLNAQFTLRDARARLPYLAALGISHLYCSPILAARPGSVHGYDVTDPTQISSALGGEEAFVELATDAHARGLGILLDIVPNHMGTGAANPWWEDVLANGRESRFADWFDVAWDGRPRRVRQRIHLPVLGDTLEKVLARGEITLHAGERGHRLRYFDHSFPVRAGTSPDALERGDTEALARILEEQHYRLAHWRTASRDLNYRRFFDVNDLISLRVEREDVFNATHAVILGLVERGLVDAIRVDHIDGLLEPRRYLARLRDALSARCREPIPVLVEKILGPGESLPKSWRTDGTTGYEFLTAIDDLLIDANGVQVIEAQYRRAPDADFAAVSLAAKRRVLRSTLNADVRRVAPMLAAVARAAGWPKVTIAACAGVIVEFIAHLPVYRTYIDAQQSLAEGSDREVIESAIVGVRASRHDAAALAALERSLLDDWNAAPSAVAAERLAFVLRLQQLSGPAAAKGIEDTAIYAFAPLASRSEVGGNPGGEVGHASKNLHALLADRSRRWPRALNTVTTHDTKRSADSRARIDALSEYPSEWLLALRRWTRAHRAAQRTLRGRLVPSRATQDFIYQALIAIWPVQGAPMDDTIHERATEYIRKALREGKVATSWTDPDAAFEDAIAEFIGWLFAPDGERFRAGIGDLVASLDQIARVNMLSRVVIQHTAPGVPDIYQGDELWFTALVDPDNRRPVDRVHGDRALERTARLPRVVDAESTSDLKFAAICELLRFRRRNPAIFQRGAYEPIAVLGAHARHVFAFQRTLGEVRVISVVGTTTRAVAGGMLGAHWGDTRLAITPDDVPLRCVLHDARVITHDGSLYLRELFSAVPAAVLVSEARVP